MSRPEGARVGKIGRHASVYLASRAWRRRPDGFPGTKVDVIVDGAIGGADLYGGLIRIQPGRHVPRHWHRRGEIQFILSGRGYLLRPDGGERRVGACDAVFSPAGRAGAHGFRAVGREPLAILFFYGSPGGKRPWIGVQKSAPQ